PGRCPSIRAHRASVNVRLLKIASVFDLESEMRPNGNPLIADTPYSPDLNPIEMAFSKLKALIRKAAARTYDQLWQAVGHVCNLFTDEECYNFFKAAGYGTD
ncbi:hypothetical protein ACVDG3_22655, partial [Meridianimarinicoccus sp. RP-17]